MAIKAIKGRVTSKSLLKRAAAGHVAGKSLGKSASSPQQSLIQKAVAATLRKKQEIEA